jgi:hypothetical protein
VAASFHHVVNVVATNAVELSPTLVKLKLARCGCGIVDLAGAITCGSHDKVALSGAVIWEVSNPASTTSPCRSYAMRVSKFNTAMVVSNRDICLDLRAIFGPCGQIVKVFWVSNWASAVSTSSMLHCSTISDF